MALETWGLLSSTFLFCLASAVIPFVHAEVYLLGVAALAPASALPAVVVAATAGQMAGKSILYLLGRGAWRLPERWRRPSLGVSERWLTSRVGVSGLVVTSAFSGLPPFYAVTLMAGSLGWSFPRFVAAGTLGRVVRFSAVVAFPTYARSFSW